MRLVLLFTFILLAVAAVAAPLLAAGHPLAALLIRSFFAQVCHQQIARSFVIEGAPVAVCVRCLGIYCGVALGAAMRVVGTRRLFALTLLLNLIDVATAMLHWHGNWPLPRFVLGLVLGWSAGALLAEGTRAKSRALARN